VLDSNRFEKLSYIGVMTAMVLGLYLSSLHSYLLFHSLIEITTIAVGFTFFILTWNTRKFQANNFLTVLGIGYAFIALIDVLHTLAFKGMSVFPSSDANLSTQLWIAARFLQAVTLCAAPLFTERRLDNRAIFGVYAAATSVLVTMVFSGNFPNCYTEGNGLTPFKISSEYVITALLLISSYLFYRKRRYFNNRVFFLTVSSIACTALSEISFTEYVSMYDFANMVGHFFRLAAFYLIYRAILVTGLREPFDLIFRDLKQAEEGLQKSHDTLEEKVRERTAKLQASSKQLWESEQRFRSLVENLHVGVLLQGPRAEMLLSNPRALELLGLTEDQMLGKTSVDPFWNVIHEDGSPFPGPTHPVPQAITNGQAVRNVIMGVYRPKTNSRVWLLVDAEPQLNTDSTVRQVICTFSDITERKRAEKYLAERVMLAELSADIGDSLAKQGELLGILNACAEALVRRLDVAFARIWTLNTAENVLELQASAGMYTRIDGSNSRVPVGQFKIGLIAAGRNPQVTNAVVGNPSIHDQEWAKREGMVAFAGYPLTLEDKVVGVMAMFSRNPLTDAALKTLASVSDEIAIGIERKRAEKDLAERVMLAELSADIGFSLAKLGELRSILNACAEALVRRLDVAFVRIWTLDAAEDVLELQASAGMYTSIDGSHSRIPVGKFKIGLIASGRNPHITNAVIGDPCIHDQEWAKREGMVAFAGHPLTIEDKLVGVMAMFSRNPFTGATLKVLASVSNEIAIGIERKRAEEGLHRLNRELRAISTCNETVIRAEDEQTLLNDICRIACDEAGYRMAWVGYAENDEAKTIRPAAWAGAEDGYLEQAKLTWANTERGRGPAGTAIRSGEAIYVHDFTRGPKAAQWRENALQRGYRSSIALPLKDELEKTFGVLNIYSTEPNAFTADEMRLLEELSGDLAFGITALRTRGERKRAEGALRKSEEHLKLEVARMPVGYILWDKDFRVVTWNPAAEEIFGFTFDETKGRHPYETIVPPEAQPQVDDIWARLLAGDASAHSVNENLTKDGHTIVCEWTNTPLKQPDGTILGVMSMIQDITERKRAEEERLASLRFFASMDRVNRAIQVANDVEQMMSDVLDAALSIFNCDRAWLFYPCDPDAPSFRVPMEITKPEYPGAGILNVDVPMPPDMAQNLREALESADPVTYNAGTGRPVNKVSVEQFGVKSMMMVALYPKLDKPWAFGLHQCSYPRVWTPNEEALFQEIGRRLGDGLSSLSAYRNLREREEELRCLNQELEQRVRERTSQLEIANKELEAFSYRDGLTGISNRRHFDQQLELEWRRCGRRRSPLSLIMVDIDFFKFYNDSYGHLQGDECLKQVAACISSNARRAEDLVARYGGEEFIVLLPDTDIEVAGAVAEAMRSAVEALNLPHPASLAAGCVTISLGVAGDIPIPRENPHNLVSVADRALYKTKSAGRNRVSTESSSFEGNQPQQNSAETSAPPRGGKRIETTS